MPNPPIVTTTVIVCLFSISLSAAEPIAVGPIPDSLRTDLKIPAFYQKFATGGGIPVIGSAKVTDHALAEAAWIIRQMLSGRDDILKAMNESKVRAAVMAASEATTDLPEHASMKPKLFWDRRARGLGATPRNPVVSCGEENLLGYPRDPYPAENIFVHEFAHAIHGTGMNRVDRTFDGRLREAFEQAMARGLWKNTYAASNRSEYWAEGVQCWFDDNAPPDALHNDIRTRTQLKEYDPPLAKLCHEVFGERPWKYVRPALRPASDRSHLSGYDAAKLPAFHWKAHPITDRPKVTVETQLGEILIELDAKNAPAATKNFLTLALNGGFHSGQIVRASGSDGHGLLRIVPKAKWFDSWKNDLKLEAWPEQPKRLEGAQLAFVRNGQPGEWVIAVGQDISDKADLIPFGFVTKGMDLAKRIHALPRDGETLKSPVDMKRVIRTE